jgi:translation elongation factor EF-G
MIQAGDIAALIGVSLKVGDTFGDASSIEFEMMPTLVTRLSFDSSLNPKDIYKDMKILEEEDPSLLVNYSSKKEITLGIMGTIQLEILKEVIPARFGYKVDFMDPQIIYKETIQSSVIGCGHFEPLKHYAEVILNIEPAKKGEGIIFENKCSTDHLTVGSQNLVKHHLYEKAHRGVLTGSEITDIKVTLLTGRAHNKHTSGGDFREATIRALRQGLEQAETVLLEPMYEALIRIPFTDMGKVLTDITTAHGTAETAQDGDDIIITARVPVYTFKDYHGKLLSITSGKGRMRLKVIGYDVCHNQEEVVEEIAYDKITDDEYPSGSIFCTKGKGYTIPWEEAKAHMHTI